MRIKACPHDSPLWIEWRHRQDKAEAQRKVDEVEDTLAIFTNPRPKEG